MTALRKTGDSIVRMRFRPGIVGSLAGSVSAGVVPFTPTGGLASTNVQAALAELDSEKMPAVTLATVATSGSYGDLLNRPALFDGTWSSLTGKPTLFSGAYADLTGKPTIPAQITALAGLTTDVLLTSPSSGQFLSYNGTKWVNVAAPTGGGTYTLPAATATVLGGVKANAGSGGQFVNGVAVDGSLTYGTPATGQASSVTLTNIAALTGAASRLLAFTGANTVTTLTYGTSGANAILQLDGTGKLPAVDGSQLTNLPSGTTLGSVTPSMDGTAAIGTATTAAHADHIHPTDTSRAKAGANSDITSLTGLTTALSVAQGGTGATTGQAALTSLGAQASSALLTAIAGVSAAANKVLAFTGAAAATVLSYGSTAAANILLQLDANGRINAQQTQNLRETVNALGNVTGTATIDLSLGDVVTATMTAATTFSFTNPPASGISKSFVLKLSAAGFAATWPASVHWQGGTAPTLAATGRNRLWFTTEDGGTTWDGALSGAWT